jgi:hypothetical protein
MGALIPPTMDNRKNGFGRAKRYSLKIDMTPMVDLGFTWWFVGTQTTAHSFFKFKLLRGDTHKLITHNP